MTTIKDNGQIEFRFFRPGASNVKVIGDFTGWNGGLEMIPECDGWWRTETQLRRGEYRFRYLVDGNWYTDYAANGVERNPFGWDSVLVVKDKNKTPATVAA